MEMLLHPILFPAVIAMEWWATEHPEATTSTGRHLFCLHGCLHPMHVHDNHIRERERERGTE